MEFMQSEEIYFLINFLLLISGSSGIVISGLLYLSHKTRLIKIYFLALVFWTVSQLFYHVFYYLNEVIHYTDQFVNVLLNDLTFVFIAPFVFLLIILIHEIFKVEMAKGALQSTKIAVIFLALPSMVLKYFLPDYGLVWDIIEALKGIGFYFFLYFIAFDINRHLSIIINDDIRRIFKNIFYLQMAFYPLMIIESISFFERSYPFGISVVTLFYAVVNLMWLYFVSRYLHLPEIKLIAEEPDSGYENFFAIFKLTKREKEVTKLLLSGLSYEDVAKQLFITLETVKTHVNNIYKKSGVGSKIELSNLVQKCKNELK